MLVTEDVVESSRQFRATFSVEYDLTRADITMSHALVMHEVERAQYLLRQVLQYRLWHCADALGEIVQAAIGCIVLDN